MARVRELLPAGSVVLLEGGEKRLMVIGVKQTKQDTGEEYDYIGLLYPEGYIDDEGLYMFNHEDIQMVYFRGYEDGERENFVEMLENFYKEDN